VSLFDLGSLIEPTATVIERRQFLRVGAGVAASLMLGLPTRSWAAEAAEAAHDNGLSWADAIALLEPAAQALTSAAEPNELAYLHDQSSILARLKAVPDAQFGAHLPVAAADTHKHLPLYIVQFRLAPGATLPFHDHRDYIGVLRCIEGEARVRSFNIVGDDKRPAKGTPFHIQESGDVLLKPGRSSVVARACDNVHHVVAGPAGARLLDVFTFFADSAHSVFMHVDEKPLDADKRIYGASWA
jgi:predicted metal-dependent enzyme (double-stranded beta helix superfamily)